MYYLLYMVAFYHTIYTHNVLFFGLKQKSWIFSTFLYFEYLFRSLSTKAWTLSTRDAQTTTSISSGRSPSPAKLPSELPWLQGQTPTIRVFRVEKNKWSSNRLPPDVRFPGRNSRFFLLRKWRSLCRISSNQS